MKSLKYGIFYGSFFGIIIGCLVIKFICAPIADIIDVEKIATSGTLIYDNDWYINTFNEIKLTKNKIDDLVTSMDDRSATKRYKDRNMLLLFGLRNYLQELIVQYNSKSKRDNRIYWINSDIPFEIIYSGSFREAIQYKYMIHER